MKIILCIIGLLALSLLYLLLPLDTYPDDISGNHECTNWQVSHPQWIFCDDFEDSSSLVARGRYFEHDNDEGEFIAMESVGLNGTRGMRVLFQADEVNAGNLRLGFGRVPSAYMNRDISPTEDFREIYYRMYLKMQSNWDGNPVKLSRATVLVSDDWSQAMIAHVWHGKGNMLSIDPVNCVTENNRIKCKGYNDFNNMDWLGNVSGQTPLFDNTNSGKWFCVEAHVRLNDPNLSNGVQELWINDKLEASSNDLDFVRAYTEYAINAVFFENYWNEGAVKQQERFFDNIVVSRERIGCAVH